jgi:hypothetical protein
VTGAVKTVLFLCGVFALGALAWMLLLPATVERELRQVTGFDVHIEVLAANPFTGHVAVRGLKARNPPTYPSPDFVGLRELRADVSEFSWLFTDRLVIDDLYIDAEAVQIVRQRNGKSNAGEFMAACSGRSAGGQGGAAPTKPFKFLIKTLRLRLDRLVISDYTSATPEIRTYNLKIDHTYANVTQAKQLLVPDVVRSLYSFGLRRDTEQLLPGEFGRALADAVGAATHVGDKLKDAGQKTGQYLKGLLDKLEQSAKP